MLLRLAPDVEDRDLEEISTERDLKGLLGGGEILLESTSQEIKTRAERLAVDLRTCSQTIKNCCSSFVSESMLEKKNRYEEDAEVEYNDLKRLSTECEGWIRTSVLLVKQVLGEIPLEEAELSPIVATPVDRLSSEGIRKERRGSKDSEGTVSSSRSAPVMSGGLETNESSVVLERERMSGTPRDLATPSGIDETIVQGWWLVCLLCFLGFFDKLIVLLDN